MKKLFKSLFIILLATYTSFSAVLYFFQSDFLYHPQKKSSNSLEEKLFKNGKVSIFTTLANKGKEKAIIYFGGNFENVEYNYVNFSNAFKDHTSYLVQYRGYLSSTGKPSQKALYSDALHVYDHIKNKYKEIVVIGRSLGSGIAGYLASKRDVKKLILVTPYDSVENVAKDMFKILPISLMLKDKYNLASKVSSINSNTLIIYVEDDKVISNKRTKELIKKFPKKQLSVKILQHETHNSILSSQEYYTYMKKFIY